jgi:hypothetical protein
MAKLHPLTQDLVCMLNADGTPSHGNTQADINAVVSEITAEVLDSPNARKLIARYGKQAALDALIQETGIRLGSGNWATTACYELISECANDLALALPPLPATAPKPQAAPEPTAEEVAAKEAAKIEQEAYEKKLRAFSHMVSRQILRDGVKSLSPKMGLVTVVAENGASYQYDNSLFDRMYADSQALGLL